VEYTLGEEIPLTESEENELLKFEAELEAKELKK